MIDCEEVRRLATKLEHAQQGLKILEVEPAMLLLRNARAECWPIYDDELTQQVIDAEKKRLKAFCADLERRLRELVPKGFTPRSFLNLQDPDTTKAPQGRLRRFLKKKENPDG